MMHRFGRIGVAALLSGSAIVAGCEYGAGGPGGTSADDQQVTSTTSAILGNDTFLYLQCNATSWTPSDASRLRPTADPYVFSLDYDVTQPWMVSGADNCSLVETNQQNGWGTIQNRWTPLHPAQIVPAADRLQSGSAGFTVKYPALGRYSITVNWMQGSFSIGSVVTTVEWPNAQSSTNGDAWLRTNHDRITRLKPRVLVVHANKTKSLASSQEMAQRTAAAFREGSRYHGYGNPGAQVMLDYQFQYVDLTANDTATTDWPAAWPVTYGSDGAPHFNSTGLFAPAFTAALNIKDPQDPNRLLSVCELFERGMINELWTQAPRSRFDGNPVGVYESVARAQAYDSDLNPVPGSFRNDAGNGWLDAPCGVTVRLLELLSVEDRGVGCTMEAAGHGFEGLAKSTANPYLTANSERFFNFNLSGRYQLPLSDQYDWAYCSWLDNQPTCYAYPDSHTLTTGRNPDAPITFTRWGEGCGNVHFPPNGRANYDFYNTTQVLSTCESYAMHNGANGADAQTLYSSSLPAKMDYDTRFPDCASGWMIYLFQSMPGFGNQAVGLDGRAMKSWLPFMFY